MLRWMKMKRNKQKLVGWRKSGPQREISVSSVIQLCLTLCDPMDCSTPGLPVHHQLLEFTQAHVHWVGDAIQPSHPPSSPSPPAFNLSQHQGLFKWVSSSHQVAKESIGISASTSVFPTNIQHWFPLELKGVCGGIFFSSLGREGSNTAFQLHHTACAYPLLSGRAGVWIQADSRT